jgi:glycosyltransferase involved in cell wall biosynthesis
VRHAHSVVAVSEFEADTLARGLGLERDAVTVVRNGVSTLPIADASPDDALTGSPLLLSVGRLERYKGHHRAIAAMPAILECHPRATLVVVGDGPFRDELVRVAHDVAPRQTHFRAYGAPDRAELGRLMARADAVVLLSEYEAHPVAVIEALSLGVPVVAARTSGLIELIDAGLVTGVDIDAPPDVVADAIDCAISGARGAPELPTWDGCAHDIAALYKAVSSA